MAFSTMIQKLKLACPGQLPQPGKCSIMKNDNKESPDEDKKSCDGPIDWSEFERVPATEFTNKDGMPKITRFLSEILGIALRYVATEKDRDSKILDFHHPHQLCEIMEHCLYVDEHPRDLEQILSDCRETLKYCIRTAHPRFLNQLSTGLDVIGLAGEWITATANTNMFTYEMAPVFSLMEEVILKRMRSMIGWEDGDGIFAPGGAISNFYGLMLARHRAFPEVKIKGLDGSKRFVVFTSEQSHYSIKRAAILLGIGLQNVVTISCDHRGKMLVGDLEKKITRSLYEGKVPLFVNATCGTTVFGAFDPVDSIADVCERHGIWLHVDGAWGGSVLFSRKHRHLLSGLQRANSMTWNPHKMMGVPLQCSAVLVREKGLLAAANQLEADYLFQKDKLYDVTYDTGDKAIQCGRHNDIFKLWLMWRAKGNAGFEAQIDRNFDMASYLLKVVKGRENFEVVLNEVCDFVNCMAEISVDTKMIEGPNVCFWYVPPSMKTIENEDAMKQILHKVAPKLKAMMMEKGTMMLQYQPLCGLPNFFRVAISNPAVEKEDLDFVIAELERLGADLDI